MDLPRQLVPTCLVLVGDLVMGNGMVMEINKKERDRERSQLKGAPLTACVT
jgi:hypothetical protein